MKMVAWGAVLLSIPIAWFLVELVNQEYFQLWYRSVGLTSIQTADGTAVPLETLMWILFAAVALLWLIAFVCFKLARRRRIESSSLKIGAAKE